MNCSTPGLPVHHQLLEFSQTHVYQVGDAIQPSHPLLSPSPPAPNSSQHQGLFQWVSSLHEVAKVLVDHDKLWKALRDGNTRPSYLSPEKPVCGSRSNSRTLNGTTDWFKIEKGVTGLSAVTLFVKPIGWAHHEKCQAGWVISRNQGRKEKHQQPQICGWYHSNGRKWRETKKSLDEVVKR